MARILVIDDEPYMRDIFMDMLALDNHQVSCCSTATEGMQAYFDKQPELLITDWSLPDGSGEKIINTILAREKKCMVLVCTGEQTSVIKHHLKEKKGLVYDVLLKPFSLEDLTSLVNTFLN